MKAMILGYEETSSARGVIREILPFLNSEERFNFFHHSTDYCDRIIITDRPINEEEANKIVSKEEEGEYKGEEFGLSRCDVICVQY